MSRFLLLPLLLPACAPGVLDAPVGEGTEIGEEGGGDECHETRSVLSGPDEVPPRFERTVRELVDPWVGGFSSEEALLFLEPDFTQPVLVERDADDLAMAADCVDAVLVPVTLSFVADGVTLSTPAGEIEAGLYGNPGLSSVVTVLDSDAGTSGFSEDGVVTVPGDPGEAALEVGPETFDPSRMALVEVGIFGTAEDPGWSLVLLWRGWSTAEDSEPQGTPKLEAAWNGRVEPD